MSKYNAVLFDLDGTLLDTSRGVKDAIIFTTKELGLTPPSEEELQTFMGPPMKKSMIRYYGMSDKDADVATEIFRNRYKNHDLLKATVYDGLENLLKSLKDAEVILGVATYKREDYAIKILEEFNLSKYFKSICGDCNESTKTKADIMVECMENLNISREKTLFVGDTTGDSSNSDKLGVDFCAVTYGFGFKTEEELNLYPRVFTAKKPIEILSFVEGNQL